MKQLTWFFVVAVLTAFVTLLLTQPAHPDDFAAHLKALQEKNAAKPKPVEAPKRECVVPHVGMRYKHPDNGRWYTYEADGYWHPDPHPVQYAPPQVYEQRAPAFFFGRGGSSC